VADLKVQNKTIEIFVFSVSLFFSTGVGVQAAAYVDVVAKHLNMGPATALNFSAHGRSSYEIDKILVQIYRDNGLQPYWITDGRPNQSARDIHETLGSASKHGLTPSSYLLNNIDQFWDSSDSAGLVKLDILLTLGMMLYVADQREGRLQPRQMDPELFAHASDVEVEWKKLFAAAFKAPDMKAFLAEQVPPFLQYRYLQEKLGEYRTIAAKGGWPSVPDGVVLKPGMADSRTGTIRKRLTITGEYRAGEVASEVFDPQLVKAVKIFQKHHNLAQDGVIGSQTLAAMNVTVEFRIRQIIINMERYRWLKRVNDERLVAVNIAGFEAVAGRSGTFDIIMPVIVGKTYHKTPVFSDTIEYVDFNPYWNVPPSIATREMLPTLRKDASYLKKQNMRIFHGWEEGAPELDAMSIDWGSVSETEMKRYRIRQEPGPNNSLGTLKIVFPNKHNVYLHDTPDHDLFSRGERAFSHGCIRMGRPAEMAAWVLGGEEKGWNVDRVKEIIKAGKRKVVKLEKPMPVYILYRTAFVGPDDHAMYFYPDIYGRDTVLAGALPVVKR